MNQRPATALRSTDPVTLPLGVWPDGTALFRDGSTAHGRVMSAADLPAFVPTFLPQPRALTTSVTVPAGYNVLARAPLEIPAGVNLSIEAGANVEIVNLPELTDLYVGYDREALAVEFTNKLLAPSQDFCATQARGSWTKFKNNNGLVQGGSAIVPGGLEVRFPPAASVQTSWIYSDTYPTAQEFAVLCLFDVTGATASFTYIGFALMENETAAADMIQGGVRTGGAVPSLSVNTWTADTVQGSEINSPAPFNTTAVLMKVRGNHVTTWVGTGADDLILSDVDRTLTFTPTKMAFGGYSPGPTTSRSTRCVIRKIIVVPSEYSTAADQLPPRLCGRRIYQLGA